MGRPYVDAEVIVTMNPNLLENMSPDSLDSLYTSPSFSLPSPSSKCHNLSPVSHYA